MILSAKIRQTATDDKTDASTLETRDIVGTGADYDAAKADVDGQIPEGWGALYVMEQPSGG